MGYWAAAQFHSRHERLALHCLGLAGFTAWLPRILERRRLQGRWRQVPCPLFRGYLFVLIEARWHEAHYCPGVSRLLMNGERPAPIPDQVIAELRAREIDGVVKLPEPPPRLCKGGKVRIATGPFRGHLGLIAGLSPRERVTVLLKFLGGDSADDVARRRC